MARLILFLQISPNGIIRTQDDKIARVDPWTSGKTYDILVYKVDAAACPASDKKCGIYWRKVTKKDTTTLNTISKIVGNGDMDKHLLQGQKSQIPSINTFKPDPERTLVVTWYRVPHISNAAVSYYLIISCFVSEDMIISWFSLFIGILNLII